MVSLGPGTKIKARVRLVQRRPRALPGSASFTHRPLVPLEGPSKDNIAGSPHSAKPRGALASPLACVWVSEDPRVEMGRDAVWEAQCWATPLEGTELVGG